MKSVLCTGTLGNLGVFVSQRLLEKGYHVVGLDNNGRMETLGDEGDVLKNLKFLKSENFVFAPDDITTIDWAEEYPTGFDVIVHCAAQVSHPRSIEIPIQDFRINAWGTLNLLDYVRTSSPQAQFIHIGTAKIYGENVDHLWPYEEKETRYWYQEYYSGDFPGVNENCSFDRTRKTPFGCSKAYADLIVQEYAFDYGLQTSVLRPGVFTGKYAKPVIYQNWVGDLIKEVLTQEHVDIIGWEGKQVRDVLHTSDLVDAIMLMIDKPPPKGEVYNIAGGMNNAISVIEAFNKICDMTGRKPSLGFLPNREGDWCVYVGDNSKLQKQYPEWKVTRDLDYIFEETLEQLS